MIIRLLYIFFMGSVFGWLLETVYRRFYRHNKTRRWINPGFLIGPCLPIYGFGVCALFLLADIERFIHINNDVLSKIFVLILMSLAMTFLELIAGLIFIQGMKVKLWDYSNKKFNFKGVICLEFSVYWLLLAAVYYLFIHKYVVSFTDMLLSKPVYMFPLGIVTGVFMVDFGYSIQIVAKIKQFATEHEMLVKYEELKSNIRKYSEEHREKYMFMFAFNSKRSLSEHLVHYSQTHPKFKKFGELMQEKDDK